MIASLLLVAVLALPPKAPAVGCAQRIEGGRPIGDSLPGDVSIGRLTFSDLGFAASATRSQLTPARGKRWRVWKAAPVVDAGGPVTVAVAAADRAHLRLSWRGGNGPAVTFSPCAPGTPAFSYHGRVGDRTAWAGGFLVDGPGCRHIEVWADRQALPLRRTISFGAGTCR
jgi:hypothetical protein